MKEYNYHALFYYRVLSTMQSLKGDGGVSLSDTYSRKKDEPRFGFAYEPRPNFEFQYQRDKYLVSRDRYVLIGKHGEDQQTVLVKYNADNDEATIYRKALDYIFGEEGKEAFNELKELLEKFYTVKVEDKSNLTEVDTSTGRGGSPYYVVRL